MLVVHFPYMKKGLSYSFHIYDKMLILYFLYMKLFILQFPYMKKCLPYNFHI